MSQDVLYYRPPSEADSFLVRVMEGCPHNACTFCGMYKGIQCKVLPLETILRGIEQDAEDLGDKFLPLLTSLYLEGGDPMALPMNMLRPIIAHAKTFFPALERVACYATAASILHKSQEELQELAHMGLERVHVGLESGSDAILKKIHKGCSRADLLLVGIMLRQAGIENDSSMMLGIGGMELSEEHALKTASLINEIAPACVRIRTFIPTLGTPMGTDYLEGRLTLMDPYQILRELRLLTENIAARTELLSEHWTNFIRFSAKMPKDKGALLTLIDQALTQPREKFRETGIAHSPA